MKIKCAVFLISISSIIPALANTFECNKDDGIKECQKQAKEFCDEKSFNIKSSDKVFKVSCDETGEQSNKVEISNATEARWKLAIGLGYNLAGTAESDLRITNTNTNAVYTGTAEFDIDPGASINLEARYLAAHNWGFTAGIDIDLPRDVKSGTVTLGGETVTFSDNTSDPDTLMAVVFYGNLVYKWENFYIPFGLNFSAIDYESTGLIVNSEAGIGAQLGLGFEYADHFAFEIFSRALGYQLDYISGNLDVDFEEGIMTDIALRAKYIF